MLVILVTISLFVLAVYAIAKTTRVVMARLGLDVMSVLLWLGLAERPTGT